MAGAKTFFSEAEKQEIILAIREAESLTSGEIRVHLEERCRGEVLAHAIKVFQKLKMDKTQLRNGVLIYLAVKDRKFAIVADEGINQKVPLNFWEEIKISMQENFTKGIFLHALKEAIAHSGAQLKQYFPFSNADKNELSDEISFTK